MTADWLAFYTERLLGFGKTDEFNGNDSTLVQELEETVLTICSRLAKIHHSCLVIDLFSLCVDSLAVAFHIKLLNVWGEFAQGLAVGNDGPSRIILDYCSVKAQKAQQ